MGKYDSYIIQKILFLSSIIIFHCGVFAVAMQDASTQGGFKLTTSTEALKEDADATLKMFKTCDSTAVDSNDDEDEMGYLCENSGSEADW